MGGNSKKVIFFKKNQNFEKSKKWSDYWAETDFYVIFWTLFFAHTHWIIHFRTIWEVFETQNTSLHCVFKLKSQKYNDTACFYIHKKSAKFWSKSWSFDHEFFILDPKKSSFRPLGCLFLGFLTKSTPMGGNSKKVIFFKKNQNFEKSKKWSDYWAETDFYVIFWTLCFVHTH